LNSRTEARRECAGLELRTSESVTEGHPDKLADQISDAILDSFLAADPLSRVAVETLISRNYIVISGETTSKADVDVEAVARRIPAEVGYTSDELGFDANACRIDINLRRQASEIAQGVDGGGAGDQGIMFGFACEDTPELMPAPIAIAHALTARMAEVRREQPELGLRPDGKSQVTVAYEGEAPKAIHTVVLSIQHEEWAASSIREVAESAILAPVLERFGGLDATGCRLLINPTGSFVSGGPACDTGLTGRKIVVDTYGGAIPVGGGAFSGKDPTKVDRSAAYLCRQAAKRLVASGTAKQALVSVAYAIGVKDPLALQAKGLDEKGAPIDLSGLLDPAEFAPEAIIGRLGLRRPIYRQTARNGHFGNPAFPWEVISLAGK